ncbi:AN34A protein, partial [Alaudala cheleensis]|nr:AN34A protein [Alaudala cheleensis]
MIPAEGSALLRAVSQGKFRLTRLLLEGGAYINEGNAAGTTPLMAACRAGYADPPDQPRMVQYLLENGADPNIPDKAGKTALMHACAERAGPAVAAVLLAHGADPSARDYAGGSALLYALERGDRETLQVLLDACRDRGRDVIIITSATSPRGTKTTRQYLNSPPSPALCASPSQVQVRAATSPGASARDEERDVFRFPPAAPGPAPEPARAGPKRQLKRLNSEPWGLAVPGVEGTRGHSEGTQGSLEGTQGPPEGARRALDEIRGPLEVTWGPSEGSWGSPEGPRGPQEGTPAPAERLAAGLEGLRLRRHSVEGREVSGLPGATWAERVPPVPTLGRWVSAPDPARGKPLRRDPPAPEPALPGPLRHPAGLLERRGSGTLPLEPPGPGRAGLLPPLPPRALLRRHSMQPEALRHLGAFCGGLGPEPGS